MAANAPLPATRRAPFFTASRRGPRALREGRPRRRHGTVWTRRGTFHWNLRIGKLTFELYQPFRGPAGSPRPAYGKSSARPRAGFRRRPECRSRAAVVSTAPRRLHQSFNSSAGARIERASPTEKSWRPARGREAVPSARAENQGPRIRMSSVPGGGRGGGWSVPRVWVLPR